MTDRGRHGILCPCRRLVHGVGARERRRRPRGWRVRHDRAADGAAAAVAARHLLGAVDHAVAADFPGFAVRKAPGRFLVVSDHPADLHVVPVVVERGIHPFDPAQRRVGAGGRRARDRGVRELRGRRQLCCRFHPFLHPAGHQLHRHHQGRRPRGRSRCALHPGRAPWQADGSGRGAERGVDR